MRIAWFDTHDDPWTKGDGWGYLKEHNIDVVHCRSINEARDALKQSCAAFVVAQEVVGALEFLTELRTQLNFLPTMLVSSSWTKQDFQAHAKTPGAAHRYARTPMPPEGFLDVLCGLLKTTRQELKASAQVTQSSEVTKPFRVTPEAPRGNTAEEVETLRKYLQMREEELALLQGKFSEMDSEYLRLKAEVESKDKELRSALQFSEDLERRVKALDERIFGLERDLIIEQENRELVVKTEREKQREIEAELNETKDRHESLKARVRKDLRKIRVRERDLESKLELLRIDSDRMVESRDSKVLELQRKIDALEFDLDQIQDSRHKALTQAERYLAKLARVSRTLQLATSLIEDGAQEPKETANNEEPFLGGAIEGLEDIGKLLSEAEAIVGASPEEESEASAAPTAVDTPDDLLAAHDAEAAPASTSTSFSNPELEALASDGEATRIVTRPQELEEENADGIGKLDLASDIDAAG